MRSETKRAAAAVAVLSVASIVTLATSTSNLRFFGGAYDVESTCAGFQESGVLTAHFYSSNSASGMASATATPARTSSPSAPTATDAADLLEGTAPGAKAFGFPSEFFTAESVRPGYIFTSALEGRTCRAVAHDGDADTLVFLCREDTTDDVLCRISLKKRPQT